MTFFVFGDNNPLSLRYIAKAACASRVFTTHSVYTQGLGQLLIWLWYVKRKIQYILLSVAGKTTYGFAHGNLDCHQYSLSPSVRYMSYCM